MGFINGMFPKDLNHGHQQTLVGNEQFFEVIHEDAVNALVPLYVIFYMII